MLFQHMIDYDVIDYNTYMRLYEDTMEVDYQLIKDAIVITDEYLAVITDGTFRPYSDNDTKVEQHTYPDEIPLQVKDKSPAQIIISEYTMETFVKSAEVMGWFDRSFRVKASTVETYISDFEFVYGTSMQ